MEIKVSFAESIDRLPEMNGMNVLPVLKHGSLLVEIFRPKGVDTQVAHTRDEAYVVVRGWGEFVRGDARVAFQPGDLLFVPAGTAHRFEKFTDDLAVWVFFFGPEGGEKEAPSD